MATSIENATSSVSALLLDVPGFLGASVLDSDLALVLLRVKPSRQGSADDAYQERGQEQLNPIPLIFFHTAYPPTAARATHRTRHRNGHR
jgi:hypothetical protein